ncbi:hypothetical protein KP509_33G066400 [Ceratopteris richardii]|uniref:Thioredoxin domain-containing protein n=1 Tax=Ceratopteris richardii TaxID=49495 RepID=A0A8T2QS12_CERRI|nr:hypothetical protein KP509_33G066400 [Ceratopteris richardii]
MAALCCPARQSSAFSSFRSDPGFGVDSCEVLPHGRSLRFAPSIRCASAAALSAQSSSTGLLQAPSGGQLQCPTAPPPRPRTSHGDWNARMLFNRGRDSVKAVDKDTLWPALEAAGDKPVVLDMYSKWCGPCRLIYPKLVELSDQYSDVVFLKLDCSSDNKTVFNNLGIGILPTFKIFKNNSLVSEVRGAKYDELVKKIEKVRSI